MAGLHRVKPLEAPASEFLRPIDQLLLFDDLERREPSGASDRTVLVRIMSERRVWRAIEPAGAGIAASGMIPPPRPLPMTRMSGVAPNCSQAYRAPVRARQLGISSKINKAP